MFYKLVIYEMHILHDRCLQFTFDLDKGYFPPERAYDYNIPDVYFNIFETHESLSGQKISFYKKKKNFPNLMHKFPHKEIFFLRKFKKKKKKLTPLEPQGGDKEEFGMKQDIFF